jgi:hypothetical protein
LNGPGFWTNNVSAFGVLINTVCVPNCAVVTGRWSTDSSYVVVHVADPVRTPSLVLAMMVFCPACSTTANVVRLLVAHPAVDRVDVVPLSATPSSNAVGGATVPSESQASTVIVAVRVVVAAPTEALIVTVGAAKSAVRMTSTPRRTTVGSTVLVAVIVTVPVSPIVAPVLNVKVRVSAPPVARTDVVPDCGAQLAAAPEHVTAYVYAELTAPLFVMVNSYGMLLRLTARAGTSTLSGWIDAATLPVVTMATLRRTTGGLLFVLVTVTVTVPVVPGVAPVLNVTVFVAVPFGASDVVLPGCAPHVTAAPAHCTV